MTAIYKKGINKKEEASDIEYVVSNNLGVYINMPINYRDFAPYHGLFIKQKEFNSEMYLDRIIDELQVGKENIDLEQGEHNKTNNVVTEDWLEEFNISPVPTEKYVALGVTVIKKYVLSQSNNVLCIRYEITNNSNSNIKIKSYPCVTKRELFEAKRESKLKLTSNQIESGVKVSLSIRENTNLYLTSQTFKSIYKENHIFGLKSNHRENKKELKTYINDVYVPAIFEADVKKGKSNILEIFVSLSDEKLEDYSYEKMLADVIRKNEDITAKINDKYYELESLAISANNLNYIDRENKKFVVLDSIPFKKDKKEYITNLVSSIDGNYITLGKYRQAYMIMNSVMNKINHELEKGNITEKEKMEADLTFIDVINKYIAESECDMEEKESLFKHIEKIIEKCIEKKKSCDEDTYIDDDALVVADEYKYLKMNCLWYNALKIYINQSADIYHDNMNSDKVRKVYNVAEQVKNNIQKKFWDSESKLLRYEAKDIAEASSDMLYALCLSNPVICDSIAIKIIDSIFKELYTPYGIRKFGIKSEKYDGYVYPHLMANFVKANLRQNGVTRATQKIAYNLVKELLLEINKSNVGSVKYMYDDKTKRGYGPTISGITNAEMVRLFDMLT